MGCGSPFREKLIMHPYSHEFDVVPKQGRAPTEEELHNLFLPFRGFCARKGIIAKELVLHDIDVPSALTDYMIDNSITNIVLGAPRWNNAFIRKFKDVDVPTSLIKSLPESCMVHIISKGKVQNIQPTGCSQNITMTISSPQSNYLSKDLNRKSFKQRIWRRLSNDGGSFCQNNNARLVRCMSHRETYPSRISISDENQNVVDKSHIYDRSKSSKMFLNSMETEKTRLKQEKKRVTKKCRSASVGRESGSAKQMAMEVEKCKQEEWSREKARLVERAALNLAEAEKQKTSAELKTQKRKQEEVSGANEEAGGEERMRTLNESEKNKLLFKRYNIEEIEVAINYFDIDGKIGEGGYGPVFKGVLDQAAVAVKALRPDITQGEKQFHQEVLVLSSIRHPNIVILLGACPEYGCLVYEYLENGSLEDRLFQKDNTLPIPWKTRFKIASEIATGLLYLHKTKPEPVVHRDLKPANILLDGNYVSKITDVGLARLVPPSIANKTTQYHKTTAAGTFCYIDPEYQQTGLLGVKSDIYSLGVMLLQIITGKPPIGVAHLVEEAIQNGTLEEVLDPNVTDWPVEEALSFAKLALNCCEMRKKDRPDLATVILPELNRLRDLEL
ncbi:U-box domain-containing protein 51-like isoform X2 [Cicer arietinum]|uniref:U-box domain-containing protein 35-like isoform X2 n=1 Tax=Cicer arietinum TaxID=3827 RepID=A0A3Q7XT71_CICAR|nr:U-box domain-containing protein 35-like isoform X2 [Cicer arietinum]XP_027191136.1 U-box domain-containing protein 35-like isoform X2 [Cicer arietinum]